MAAVKGCPLFNKVKPDGFKVYKYDSWSNLHSSHPAASLQSTQIRVFPVADF